MRRSLGLKRRPSKIRGGSVLGHAGQGCIIHPTWSTTVPEHIKGKYITKIMSKVNSDSEYGVSNYLKKLDPDGLFGVYNEGPRNCKETTLERLAREGIEVTDFGDYTHNKCFQIAQNILLKKDKQYCTITIPKFDSDVSKKLPLNHYQIIDGLKNLWRGLAFYHNHNVVHNDIKKDNIAFSDGTFKYFDWGWSAILLDKKATEKHFKDLVKANMVSNTGPTAPNLLLSEPVGWHMQRDALKFCDVFALAATTLKILNLNEVRIGRHLNLKQYISIILQEGLSDTQDHDSSENYADIIISYL